LPGSADVIIVGGGVVGLSAAYFAAQTGAAVTVVEKGRIGSGASSGNAGILVSSFCDPLPGPRTLAEGIGFLLDRRGPLSIRPARDPGFVRWLLLFLRSSTPTRHRRGQEVLSRLNLAGLKVHRELAARGGTEYGFTDLGLLYLFLGESALAGASRHAARLAGLGIGSTVLNRQDVRDLEPAADPAVAGGVLYHGDAALDPARFLSWLIREIERAGGRVLTGVEAYDFARLRGRVLSVRTTAGEMAAGRFVLATGAWLPVLARRLGRRLPLTGAKGYSLTFPFPAKLPKLPLILEENHVAVSPLGERLRLTGILDLTGLDESLDPRRLGLVQPQSWAYLPAVRDLVAAEYWCGLRPASADGLPVVGRLAPWANVFVAAGHDTKGMTLGPLAGLEISRLLTGRPVEGLDEVLSPQRFAGDSS
jgi:D-amino-acid dehydrogenase